MTLLDRWKKIESTGGTHPWLLELAAMASDEIEVMRAEYGARVAYLEHQNEETQRRLAILEALCQSNQ